MGLTSVAIGISRNQRPASTGESTSCSRDTVLNAFSARSGLATRSSAVPKRQSPGSLIEGVTITSAAFMPAGYTSTEFQLSNARFALVLPPAEKPSAAAVAR